MEAPLGPKYILPTYMDPVRTADPGDYFAESSHLLTYSLSLKRGVKNASRRRIAAASVWNASLQACKKHAIQILKPISAE